MIEWFDHIHPDSRDHPVTRSHASRNGTRAPVPPLPLGAGGSRTRWGEKKRNRTMSLTDTAWDLLTARASSMRSNRSDVLEEIIRTSCGGDVASVLDGDES